MAKRTDFTDWAEDQLAPLGTIRVTSMFAAKRPERAKKAALGQG
jgi:hypothetical protein